MVGSGEVCSKRRTNLPILGVPIAESVKPCVCRVGFSSPSRPSLSVSPGASLLHQGTSAAAEERLGGVRELLFSDHAHQELCCSILSPSLACFSYAYSHTCLVLVVLVFFLDTELHIIFLLQFSWQMTVQFRPPCIPSLFLFLLDLSHYWGFNQGLWQTSSK